MFHNTAKSKLVFPKTRTLNVEYTYLKWGTDADRYHYTCYFGNLGGELWHLQKTHGAIDSSIVAVYFTNYQLKMPMNKPEKPIVFLIHIFNSINVSGSDSGIPGPTADYHEYLKNNKKIENVTFFKFQNYTIFPFRKPINCYPEHSMYASHWFRSTIPYPLLGQHPCTRTCLLCCVGSLYHNAGILQHARRMGIVFFFSVITRIQTI